MGEQGGVRVNEPVIIDAGTLEFSEEDMTATGVLIPFGIECRSNLGMFTYAPGVLDLPTDLTGMSLNLEHKREDVVGGFSRVWETDAGVMATFKYRDTPAGRAAFKEGREGKRKHLSAEVANVRIRDRKALPGGSLFAAAQVERPAFAGATLLAAEDTPPEDAPAPEEASTSKYVTRFTDADGVEWERVSTSTSTTTVTKITDDAPAPDDAADTEQENTTLNATATDEAPKITVPTTFLGSAPRTRNAELAPEDVPLATLFAAMASIKNRDPEREDAATLLAALADIKYNAAGGLTGAGSDILQPAWVGKLWQGRRYQRRYIDLATHLFGGIQLGGREGYTMTAGGELVQEWAGNKADIPTGGATTAKRSASRRAYAWGADLAREWFDLEGGADVIASFMQLVVDSYARVTDRAALTDLFTAASTTAVALDRLVAPEALPAGTPANVAYYPAVVQLIQAIEAVNDADDEPAFAVVNPTAWKQLIYTPKDLLPEYVSLSVRAGTGEGNVDGKVIVKKAPQTFFPGTVAGNPQTLAGAKGAVEFREQGETPIQLDALDIARGGVDKATIGYLETFVVRPESLVLIGTKP